jgi:hypothetical protein
MRFAIAAKVISVDNNQKVKNCSRRPFEKPVAIQASKLITPKINKNNATTNIAILVSTKKINVINMISYMAARMSINKNIIDSIAADTNIASTTSLINLKTFIESSFSLTSFRTKIKKAIALIFILLLF